MQYRAPCFHAHVQALALCLALVCGPALSAALPGYLMLSPGATVDHIEADENFGEANIPTPAKEEAVQRGHRWRAALVVGGLPDDTPGKAVWAKLRPTLLQAGWTVVGEWDVNPFCATVRNQQGRDAWAYLKIFGRDDIRMEVIEVGVSKLALKLVPPADKPEVVKPAAGDFPYLPPLPGAKFASGAFDTAPFLMALPGQDEPQMVADGSIVKAYEVPASLSNLEFINVYRDALKAAGWTVLSETEGISYTDATVTAHYAKNGRNVWAYLHHNGPELSLRVGDTAKNDMAQALKKDCRVVLVGVFFDFDKATLKTESDATLTRARDALKANAPQAFEVQGHTDAVGKDDYNQKLSEARAKSVQVWLAANGVAATQLSAKGYGKTHPVADNDSDQGRARNRRVELACRK